VSRTPVHAIKRVRSPRSAPLVQAVRLQAKLTRVVAAATIR
jgi:hypothetical protein